MVYAVVHASYFFVYYAYEFHNKLINKYCHRQSCTALLAYLSVQK